MSVQTITITGVDGFVGHHVARLAKEVGLFVRGVSRAESLPVELSQVVDEYYSADLTIGFPNRALSDSIIHLAGLAAVGPSFADPQGYISANSSMITNMCEMVLASGRAANTRIVGVSTGAVYAADKAEGAVSESHPIAMSSPYVVSKVLVENLLGYYFTRGINSVVVRPFNHIGPGQGLGFLVPDLWNELQTLDPSQALLVGNMKTERDYLDVRDVARAYVSLATIDASAHETFNICSGKSVSGLAILRTICQEAKIPMPELHIDSTRLRPNDARRITGSARKLEHFIGWKPHYSLTESIADFIRSTRANNR